MSDEILSPDLYEAERRVKDAASARETDALPPYGINGVVVALAKVVVDLAQRVEELERR